MDVKRLVKKVGKGVVVVAAGLLAGATLGPVAPAVAAFVAKKMADVGVSVDTDTLTALMQERIRMAPDDLARLMEKKDLERIAKEVAKQGGVTQEEAFAALQYGMRDLQSTLSNVISMMRQDRQLLNAVLELARGTDAKIDELMGSTDRIESSMRDVRAILESMDRRLEAAFRDFTRQQTRGKKLDLERLRVLSMLQRQNVTLASRYGVRYDPELYVPRTREEGVFEDFLLDAGFTDKNCFLMLGDVGMGKTWTMARLSTMALDSGAPVFFVPLRHGVQSLTGLFNVQSLSQLVTLLEDGLSSTDSSAVIFLDGLDEMYVQGARALLGELANCRSSRVSFVLSCRVADWAHNDPIVQASYDLRHFIHENPDATEMTRTRGVETPVSVFMSEFSDDELSEAMSRYGLPRDVPTDLVPLLRRPYFLRVAADWAAHRGSVPSVDSPDFLIMLAGGESYKNSVFTRLGIVTHRELLYETVRQLILRRANSIPLSELPVEPESDAFRALVSSGLLVLRHDTLGVEVSLAPEFTMPLAALTLARLKTHGTFDTTVDSLRMWRPDIAESAIRLADRLLTRLTGSSGSTPVSGRAPGGGPPVSTTPPTQEKMPARSPFASITPTRGGPARGTAPADRAAPSSAVKSPPGNQSTSMAEILTSAYREIRSLLGDQSASSSVPPAVKQPSDSAGPPHATLGLSKTPVTCEKVTTLRGHDHVVVALAVDDQFVYSGSHDNTVRVWRKSGWSRVATLGHEYDVHALTVDNRFLYSLGTDGAVNVWQKDSWKRVATLKGRSTYDAALAADDQFVYSACDDEMVTVWRKGSWEKVATLEGHSGGVHALAVDDEFVYSGAFDDKVIV